MFDFICFPMSTLPFVNVTGFHKKPALHKKMKFSADLVTFADEILNGKLHFLCSVEHSQKISPGWVHIYWRHKPNVCTFIWQIYIRDVFWKLFQNSSARHCEESVQMRSFFWSWFSCTQSEYRKMRTRKNFVFGHFSRCSWVLAIIIQRTDIKQILWKLNQHIKEQYQQKVFHSRVLLGHLQDWNDQKIHVKAKF